MKPKALLVEERSIAPNDKFAIFEMNGKKIGVNTQGDPNSYQEEGLKRAVKEDAYIIVCASRTKGTTEECIYKIAKNGYEIIWFSNFFAWQQRQQLLNREGAIVVAPSVTVKSTPAQNGTDLFILHEGTKVVITDGSMKSWREIRLADGKKGWIESKKIELI